MSETIVATYTFNIQAVKDQVKLINDTAALLTKQLDDLTNLSITLKDSSK